MSANPPLTQLPDGSLSPTVDPSSEMLVLARPGIKFEVVGVRTATKKWTAKGTLYLTTTRLVFIAGGPPDPSGLVSFSLPLVDLSPSTEFVQPIFAANNLAGACTAANGDVFSFKLIFKEGGVGTFLPLYFRLLEYCRAVAASGAAAGAGASSGGPTGGSDGGAAAGTYKPPPPVAEAVATAFVDPSDPSKLFLTQPGAAK